jgi:TRAP-type C4-dicarboxylate transport system permease small subunit
MGSIGSGEVGGTSQLVPDTKQARRPTPAPDEGGSEVSFEEVGVVTDTSKGDSDIGTTCSFAPWLEKTFDVVLVFVLFGELVLLFGNTMLRAIWGQSIDWANEVAEFALSSLAFIGGAVAYHRGLHMSVEYLLDRLPEKSRGYGEAVGHYLTLLVAAIGIYLAYPMFLSAWSNWTPVLQIPKSWTLLPYIIGMALLAIFALRRLAKYPLSVGVGT